MFCCVKLLRVVNFFTLISKIARLPFAGTNGRGRLRREACQFADINTSSALPPPTGRARNKKSTWHRGSFNAIICYCVRDVIPMDSRGTFGCRWFFLKISGKLRNLTISCQKKNHPQLNWGYQIWLKFSWKSREWNTECSKRDKEIAQTSKHSNHGFLAALFLKDRVGKLGYSNLCFA